MENGPVKVPSNLTHFLHQRPVLYELIRSIDQGKLTMRLYTYSMNSIANSQAHEEDFESIV